MVLVFCNNAFFKPFVSTAEPQGRRRDLLAKELENWMSRAETIKKYLTIRKLNTQDTSVQYEEEEKGYLSKYFQ